MKDYICFDCLQSHETKTCKCSKCSSEKILDFQLWVSDSVKGLNKEIGKIQKDLKELIEAIIEPLSFCLNSVGRVMNENTFEIKIEIQKQNLDRLLTRIRKDKQ